MLSRSTPDRPVTIRGFLLLLSTLAVLQTVAANASDIYKCVAAGKTTYSDKVCGKPGAVTEVEIQHAKGIVSPDRQTVADTRARIQDQMWVDEGPRRTRTRTITRNGVSNTYAVSSAPAPVAVVMPVNVERCSQFDEKLRDLDAMARQPQTGPMQDWIKSEKVNVQAQRAALHC
jgi:hypothetical protein